jgi:hypothetical protein
MTTKTTHVKYKNWFGVSRGPSWAFKGLSKDKKASKLAK